MKRIVRLTESDLIRLVKRVINEDTELMPNTTDHENVLMVIRKQKQILRVLGSFFKGNSRFGDKEGDARWTYFKDTLWKEGGEGNSCESLLIGADRWINKIDKSKYPTIIKKLKQNQNNLNVINDTGFKNFVIDYTPGGFLNLLTARVITIVDPITDKYISNSIGY